MRFSLASKNLIAFFFLSLVKYDLTARQFRFCSVSSGDVITSGLMFFTYDLRPAIFR